MKEFLNGPGFLGTGAPLISDLSMALTLLTAILFTVGWQLARRKHFEAHRWVQTGTVVINSMVVLGAMVNSYVTHILPGVPSKLLEGDYAFTSVHALIGLAAFLLGIFVVLRGNKLVPRSMRFKNYKPFMRTAYAFYMLSTFLGVVVYVLVFIFGI